MGLDRLALILSPPCGVHLPQSFNTCRCPVVLMGLTNTYVVTEVDGLLAAPGGAIWKEALLLAS